MAKSTSSERKSLLTGCSEAQLNALVFVLSEIASGDIPVSKRTFELLKKKKKSKLLCDFFGNDVEVSESGIEKRRAVVLALKLVLPDLLSVLFS